MDTIYYFEQSADSPFIGPPLLSPLANVVMDDESRCQDFVIRNSWRTRGWNEVGEGNGIRRIRLTFPSAWTGRLGSDD